MQFGAIQRKHRFFEVLMPEKYEDSRELNHVITRVSL